MSDRAATRIGAWACLIFIVLALIINPEVASAIWHTFTDHWFWGGIVKAVSFIILVVFVVVLLSNI